MTIQRFVTIGYDDCFQILICHFGGAKVVKQERPRYKLTYGSS